MSKTNEELNTMENLWDEFEFNLKRGVLGVRSVINRAEYLGYYDLAEKMRQTI